MKEYAHQVDLLAQLDRVPSSLAYGALRVTFGEENSKEDVDYLIEKLVKTVEKLRN